MDQLLSHFFTAPFLDRKSLFRGDEQWLIELRRDENTRVVPVWRDLNLIQKEPEVSGCFPSTISNLIDIEEAVECWVLLGRGSRNLVQGSYSQAGSRRDG